MKEYEPEKFVHVKQSVVDDDVVELLEAGHTAPAEDSEKEIMPQERSPSDHLKHSASDDDDRDLPVVSHSGLADVS